MYQEMIALGEYDNYAEYSYLLSQAEDEFQEEQEKRLYEEECYREEQTI